MKFLLSMTALAALLKLIHVEPLDTWPWVYVLAPLVIAGLARFVAYLAVFGFVVTLAQRK